jgi:hypothetical protein
MGLFDSAWLDAPPADPLLVDFEPASPAIRVEPPPRVQEPDYELRPDGRKPAGRGAQKAPPLSPGPETARPPWRGGAMTVIDEPLSYFDIHGVWHDPETDQSSAASPLPTVAAEPCAKCGGPYFWGDVYGGVHCCECEPIPSRRLATGAAWQVCWSAAGNSWADWTPQHWNPFAHLEAAEAAALAARPAEDF